MTTYEQALDTLERELRGVADTFADLSDEEWAMPTLLQPYEADKPHWSVFELAGHLRISIGLTSMLIAPPADGSAPMATSRWHSDGAGDTGMGATPHPLDRPVWSSQWVQLLT